VLFVRLNALDGLAPNISAGDNWETLIHVRILADCPVSQRARERALRHAVQAGLNARSMLVSSARE
jgi:hypothetical protein